MQFFRGCSGLLFFHKMERINQTIHYYLSYPIYGSNQRHKTNNVKNDTLFKVWDPQRYLPSPYMYMGLPPPPSPQPRRLDVSRGKQTWIGATNARLFMNFLLLNVSFVIQIFLNSSIWNDSYPFFGDRSQEVSCLSY